MVWRPGKFPRQEHLIARLFNSRLRKCAVLQMDARGRHVDGLRTNGSVELNQGRSVICGRDRPQLKPGRISRLAQVRRHRQSSGDLERERRTKPCGNEQRNGPRYDRCNHELISQLQRVEFALQNS